MKTTTLVTSTRWEVRVTVRTQQKSFVGPEGTLHGAVLLYKSDVPVTAYDVLDVYHDRVKVGYTIRMALGLATIVRVNEVKALGAN